MGHRHRLASGDLRAEKRHNRPGTSENVSETDGAERCRSFKVHYRLLSCKLRLTHHRNWIYCLVGGNKNKPLNAVLNG